MREGKAEYKGKTYGEWVDSYNHNKISYEDYLIARKILVEDVEEEEAIKEIKEAQNVRSAQEKQSKGKSKDRRERT